MKLIDVYRINKEKYDKYVILIKCGNFYEVFGEDAYILKNLFNYKIRNFNNTFKVGFPLVAFNKVIDKLHNFKINYVIVDKDDVLKKKFNKNNYDLYLSKDLTIEERIIKINERLNILKNSSSINSILEKVEKII